MSIESQAGLEKKAESLFSCQKSGLLTVNSLNSVGTTCVERIVENKEAGQKRLAKINPAPHLEAPGSHLSQSPDYETIL